MSVFPSSHCHTDQHLITISVDNNVLTVRVQGPGVSYDLYAPTLTSYCAEQGLRHLSKCQIDFRHVGSDHTAVIPLDANVRSTRLESRFELA